ncbi:hypothetical protein DPEC_G00185580 [Dallia pectoralis]|uniref:Uncharacterized protein n=1 Tax=Dallia pectoralis TaxID=75939 RepID=A0ACC2GBB4_DALPE|nr:hypothetical protein DPEC_G00185580 [Dallia pectoralis]
MDGSLWFFGRCDKQPENTSEDMTRRSTQKQGMSGPLSTDVYVSYTSREGTQGLRIGHPPQSLRSSHLVFETENSDPKNERNIPLVKLSRSCLKSLPLYETHGRSHSTPPPDTPSQFSLTKAVSSPFSSSNSPRFLSDLGTFPIIFPEISCDAFAHRSHTIPPVSFSLSAWDPSPSHQKAYRLPQNQTHLSPGSRLLCQPQTACVIFYTTPPHPGSIQQAACHHLTRLMPPHGSPFSAGFAPHTAGRSRLSAVMLSSANIASHSDHSRPSLLSNPWYTPPPGFDFQTECFQRNMNL